MMEAKAYWNSRAGLGEYSGSRDRIAKQLEIEAISKRVRDGMRIFDVGCGDGETALALAERFDIDIIGMDYAEDMVFAAVRKAIGTTLKGRVYFDQGDVCHLGEHSGSQNVFDLIYTQRCLINLPDWATQQQAIRGILGLLKPGGKYLACECSRQGLASINDLRQQSHLPAITPPWHNRYLDEAEVSAFFAELWPERFLGSDAMPIAGTYAFLSRVVNARIAANEQREPDYDSEINRLALSLPPNLIRCGQNVLWEIERAVD